MTKTVPSPYHALPALAHQPLSTHRTTQWPPLDYFKQLEKHATAVKKWEVDTRKAKAKLKSAARRSASFRSTAPDRPGGSRMTSAEKGCTKGCTIC